VERCLDLPGVGPDPEGLTAQWAGSDEARPVLVHEEVGEPQAVDLRDTQTTKAEEPQDELVNDVQLASDGSGVGHRDDGGPALRRSPERVHGGDALVLRIGG
jgi:hypothetical protein